MNKKSDRNTILSDCVLKTQEDGNDIKNCTGVETERIITRPVLPHALWHDLGGTAEELTYQAFYSLR